MTDTPSEHSDAPWSFTSAPITWPQRGDVARAGWITPHGWIEDEPCVAYIENVGSADVALIVAAPELLAALESALDQAEDGLHSSPCDEPDCWVEAARCAISKAQGV